MQSSIAPASAVLRRSIVGVLLLVAPLAACSSSYDKMDATSSIPDDYHQRHPIVLTNAPNRLDIFLVGASGKLDSRQISDLHDFAAEYKSLGQGAISAMLPMAADQRSVEATFNDIRAQLSKAGVRGSLLVGKYPVSDPHLASPVELSFLKMTAAVATPCGQWPDDLASGSSTQGWDNKTYYNFGCSTQQDFAMQVADPRDLVRPREEQPSDVSMRLRAIGNIEEGEDPGTTWVTGNTSISPVGVTN
jgi:pilus assembly protein CpaD